MAKKASERKALDLEQPIRHRESATRVNSRPEVSGMWILRTDSLEGESEGHPNTTDH